MKNITVLLLLAVIMLAACANDTVPENDAPAEATLTLSLDEFPVMDGSTANIPLMVEVMCQITGISQAQAEQNIMCSTTPYAWLGFKEQVSDILLVYEPSEDIKRELGNDRALFEQTPLGRDALVFFTNEANPVDNLTAQQIQDIYSGKITNWQQVGGEDKEIIAYQRAEDSGSQALFRKLVMGNILPMDAPKDYRIEQMAGLIESLANYNNSANALGYSVFYYANYMYQQPGLKFISVDGVMPGNETIASGAYPFCNDFYVVIHADEPEDSPARRLRDWLLSPQGTAVLKNTNYVPVNE